MGLIENIYEIWENILAVALFIIIISATIAITDIDSNKAELTSTQLSQISSLLSNTNTKIQLKIDKYTKIETNSNNEIIVNVKNKEKKETYIGKTLNIEQNKNVVIINS